VSYKNINNKEEANTANKTANEGKTVAKIEARIGIFNVIVGCLQKRRAEKTERY